MSHAYGQVKFQDGTIKHFEYDGTSDIVYTQLRDTPEEVTKHWRQMSFAACKCGRSEPVIILSFYGGGVSWPGQACRHCMAITDGDDPYPYEGDAPEKTWGIPDWAL